MLRRPSPSSKRRSPTASSWSAGHVRFSPAWVLRSETIRCQPPGGIMGISSAGGSVIAIAIAFTVWTTHGPQVQQQRPGTIAQYAGQQALGAQRQNNQVQRAADASNTPTTKADFDRWMDQLSNW